MKGGWEAWTKQDGMVGVQLADGEMITVKNDGVTGYGFALEYLEKMRANYGNHLRAADVILLRQLGEERYNFVKKVPNLYNSNLAVVSMNCAFGEMDSQPDCDAEGNLHFEFARCPFRATCPFNGYAERNRGKALVCCNPVYETTLTPRQAEVAQLLAGSRYTNMEIATALGCSEDNIKAMSRKIYAALGVNTRAELMLLLKDKRLY